MTKIIDEQINKVFDKKVFENETSQNVFNHFLDTLDHLKIKFITRKYFKTKKNNLIKKTKGKDDILYLPKDLKYGELFRFVEYLSKENSLGIPQEFSNINNIAKYTKITLAKIFKENQQITTEEEFKQKTIEIARGYGISSEFISKVEKTKLSISEILSTNKNIEENKNNIPKIIRNKNNLPDLSGSYNLIESQDNIKSSLWLIDSLSLEIGTQFDINFLKRGINILRNSLGIFTIEDLKKLTKTYNIYDDIFDEDGSIKSEINKNKINFLLKNNLKETIEIRDIDLEKNPENFDKKLREKLEIDKYKEKLNKLRNKLKENENNKVDNEIIKAEKEITNKILTELQKFPYQLTEKNFGYQIKGIIQNKEIYCVGFSLIGHSLLSELGIEHKGINTTNHSCLSIHIGGKIYLFDGSFENYNKINEIKFIEGEGMYKSIKIKGKKNILYYGIEGNPDKILAASIFNNKGMMLFHLGKNSEQKNKYFNQAIECFNQAIILDPNMENSYASKGEIFNNIGSNTKNNKKKNEYFYKSLECFNQAIILNPNNEDSQIQKGIILGKLGKNIKDSDKRIKYFNQALKYFNKAEELNMYNEITQLNKGNILLELGKNIKNSEKKKDYFYDALECYYIVIKLNPNSETAYFNKSIVLSELKENTSNDREKQLYIKHILNCYDKIIELNPKHINAYTNKGAILGELGMNTKEFNQKEEYLSQALKCYNKLIELQPDNLNNLFYKGNIILLSGEYIEDKKIKKKYFLEALNCYNKILELDPSDINSYINRSIIYSEHIIDKVKATRDLFTAYYLGEKDMLKSLEEDGFDYIKDNPEKIEELKKEFIIIGKKINPIRPDDIIKEFEAVMKIKFN